MKHIEIDEELYQYLASNTQYIGESASSILRRLLALPGEQTKAKSVSADKVTKTFSLENQVSASAQVKNAEKKNVFDVINKEELAMQRGVVGRFLLLLSALHRVHGEAFSTVLGIRGRDRLYFADSEKALSESGSSTKPRQIPESRFWVITNSNTTRKKMMITEVAKALGYVDEQIEKIRDLL
ncbi:replication initiation negative regulator SeqA [Thalassotalea sp. PP2-459]|uniref:replication initiation negative regulator SeqA n=1 Tax=Thalassotalea sp. PP2-459 TaxID=1742724 RepID=UPI0009441C18|nr:replication initiation negative regulator SeqA [Thalassotalea sp. PP2-459]OKY26361.1 replication initiation regulator SeqA [Thalassotalea sp. PP2-459]